jgi:hypothetical protein
MHSEGRISKEKEEGPSLAGGEDEKACASSLQESNTNVTQGSVVTVIVD